MISDAKIAEIRERADIVEVVGDYVTLRRAGVNHKGVCPFHADTDPSFNVNSARQFFHCFGCGASGDIFGFVQRIDGIDFVESARRLAGRYSIDLPERPMSSAARTRAERAREASRRRLHVLGEAATFFEERLWAEDGKPGRQLLESRGIDVETSKKYRLGYAPNSWSALIDHLKTRSVSPKELEEVGLAISRRSGGFYDRFRHRLIFTITDSAGQAIAFSGRALDDGDGQSAKYINSPETQEYTKGKVLYGLHQARVPMSKTGEVVLVEGNFDVVAISQAGVENVVAPLGTALTVDQASLLRRRVERTIVMFDGDSAGRAAATRAFTILAEAGLASYVAQLPVGEDPDSFVRQQGVDAVKEVISKRKGLLDQIIEDSATSCDGSAQDTASRIEAMRPFIRVLRTATEGDLYRGRIADAFGVDRETVFRSLRGAGSANSPQKPQRASETAPGNVAERELIGVLLDYPGLWEEVSADGTVSMVSTPAMRRLLDEIGHHYRQKDFTIAEVVARCGQEQVGQWLAERAMTRIYNEEDKAKKAINDIRIIMMQSYLNGQIEELEKKIRLAGSAGDDEQVLELSRRKAELQRERAQKKGEIFDLNAMKA
ncbi:MAG: DNA primase [Deltaproteobacteria bacterium]|nr:DNA primase [Deltaproteobacteria bacterium]